MHFPNQAKELQALLDADQQEIKTATRARYERAIEANELAEQLTKRAAARTQRLSEILDEIGEPSISNIGPEGAEAVSIIALHSPKPVLQRVLDSFEAIYARDKQDAYFQAIPSMTDRLLVHKGLPQRFGTQWYFDDDRQPFMTPIEDFEHVNERRAAYGIEPFHWPRSLAWPESAQPWLKLPLTADVIRPLSTDEMKALEP